MSLKSIRRNIDNWYKLSKRVESISNNLSACQECDAATSGLLAELNSSTRDLALRVEECSLAISHVQTAFHESVHRQSEPTQSKQTESLKPNCDQLQAVPVESQPTPTESLQFYGQFTPPVDGFIYHRYFRSLDIRGIFVECGAFDGIGDSSCKFFEESMGWKGYNFEPMPTAFEKLAVNRPLSVNLNKALSDRVSREMFKVVHHPQLGLNFGNSSLRHTQAHWQHLADYGCSFSEVEVETTDWRSFVEEHAISHVDLFVLDVEGHEMSVLEGMRNCPVLPDLICIEVGHLDFGTLRTHLHQLGYVYDISSHVNAFFIKESRVPLFALRRAA